MANAAPAPGLVDAGTPPATYGDALLEGFVEAILEAAAFYQLDVSASLTPALEAANRLGL